MSDGRSGVSEYEERACYCDSRQCDICTPDAPPRGDLFAAAQTLAADNARLCGIVIAADALARALRYHLVVADDRSCQEMIRAADAFDVVRQGH